VAVLPDGLDFLCILFLFTVKHIRTEGLGGCPNGHPTRTHGVPLILRTFNWVSSKLMYPKVSPANTPERMTRTGMRHPKTIFLVSESSSRLAYVWRTWLVSVSEAGVGKMEVMTEGRKSDRTALLLTKRRPRPVETLITIRMSERNDSLASRKPVKRSAVGTTIKGKFFPYAEFKVEAPLITQRATL